jgi:hypothetical protein
MKYVLVNIIGGKNEKDTWTNSANFTDSIPTDGMRRKFRFDGVIGTGPNDTD